MRLYHRTFETDADLLREANRLLELADTMGGVATLAFSHGHGPAYLVSVLPEDADASEFGIPVPVPDPTEHDDTEMDEDGDNLDDSWEDEDEVEDEEDE